MKGVNKWMASKQGVVVMGVVTMCLAIYSAVSVYNAFHALNAKTADVVGIVDSWTTIPITNMTVLEGSGGTSPCLDLGDGWVDLGSGYEWPGAKTGNCICPRDADFDSSTGACNSTALASPNNCKTMPGFGSVDLASMILPVADASSGHLCGRRDGEAAVVKKKPYKERPVPDAQGTCPSSYQLCAPANGEGSRQPFCFPSDTSCPIVGARIFADLADYNSGGNNVSFPVISNRQQLTADTPFVAWRAASTSDSTGLSLLPTNDIQFGYNKVCWGFGEAEFYQEGKADNGFSTSRPATTSTPTRKQSTTIASCGDLTKADNRADTRFISLYSGGSGYTGPTEREFLKRNFDLYSGCSTSTLNADAKYIQDTMVCNANDKWCEYLKDSVNEVNDDCERLVKYSAAQSSTRKLQGWSRPEVLWANNCPVTRQEVVENEAPLVKATDHQRSLMVVNIIINVVVGLLIPAMLITNKVRGNVPCFPGSAEQEYKTLNVFKTYVSGGLKGIKLAYVIIVTLGIKSIKGFFSRAADSTCSDSLSNKTLVGLSDTLTSAYSANVQTIAVDVIMLLLALYTIYGYCSGGQKEAEDAVAEGGAAAGATEMTNPVNKSDAEQAYPALGPQVELASVSPTTPAGLGSYPGLNDGKNDE